MSSLELDMRSTVQTVVCLFSRVPRVHDAATKEKSQEKKHSKPRHLFLPRAAVTHGGLF